MKWFRLYDELVDDPKMILLPADIFRNVIFLWCVASQNDGYLPDLEATAIKLRLPVPKTRKLLADLKSRGLLDEDATGRLHPHNWSRRQFKSDGDPTSASRQKRYREQQRNGDSNGNVTRDSPVGSRSRNGPRNALRSRPESESESDTDLGESHHHPPDSSAARATGQSLISPEAHQLAADIWQHAGFSKETLPPGWCGAAMAIQKWLNDGCPGQVIHAAVTAALKRKRDGPPESFSYFAKPIASAFADYRRPNPAAPPPAPEGKINGHSSRQRTVIDAADDLIAKLHAMDGEAEASGGAGTPPARLLPPH